MKSDVVVPEVGESVSSGILASWLKEDGETVSEGDELFELETDKATLAVPAPADGVLSIQVAEDTEVQVGQTVGTSTLWSTFLFQVTLLLVTCEPLFKYRVLSNRVVPLPPTSPST